MTFTNSTLPQGESGLYKSRQYTCDEFEIPPSSKSDNLKFAAVLTNNVQGLRSYAASAA